MSDFAQSARHNDDLGPIGPANSATRPDLPRIHIHVAATGGTNAMQLDPGQGGAIPDASDADLTPQKARVLLILALAAGERGDVLREHFEGSSSWSICAC